MHTSCCVPLITSDCLAAMIGVQTTCANARYATLTDGNPYLPEINATVVDQLLKAGAVIMGKTNLPVDAADFQSYNDMYGSSRNPWNLNHTPGGSSGGSAGAVAAGLSPLEVGSDIGGSIRTPAHYSGICGHKPSQNAIDKFGMCPPYPLSLHQEDLAVVGPLCRTCDDLALMMDVLSGPGPALAAGGWALALPAAAATTAAELRVAVWADDAFCECDAEYVGMIRAAARALEAAGATVDFDARPDL
jgi:amidase